MSDVSPVRRVTAFASHSSSSSCLAAKHAEQRGKEPRWNGQPKRDWTGPNLPDLSDLPDLPDLPGARPGATGCVGHREGVGRVKRADLSGAAILRAGAGIRLGGCAQRRGDLQPGRDEVNDGEQRLGIERLGQGQRLVEPLLELVPCATYSRLFLVT